MSRTAMQASMHAWHACAHMRQTSLSSACIMHMSMHVWHIAMQASSIAIMDAGVMPCIRSIDRIMVPAMSAQFIHDGAQSIIWVEQTVHACSQAEQASIHACMTDMSIVAISVIDIRFCCQTPIIIESIAHRFRSRVENGRDRPHDARLTPTPSHVDSRVNDRCGIA